MLGSKHRCTGLAYLAAGQQATAAVHLARAVEENSELAVLHARTRFDLARALVRQSAGHDEGVAKSNASNTERQSLGWRAWPPRLPPNEIAGLVPNHDRLD